MLRYSSRVTVNEALRLRRVDGYQPSLTPFLNALEVPVQNVAQLLTLNEALVLSIELKRVVSSAYMTSLLITLQGRLLT